ncbi:MAG TPA: helix-turn-helix domain-containing protein [Solirubrobacteraceae bacterium]
MAARRTTSPVADAPAGEGASPSASPALRSDAERNRRRILDAAREVYAEHGLGVGVDVVARAAGCGVGTLYRRFPTKQDLFRAIVEDRVDQLAAALGEAAAIGDPWEAFVRAAEEFAGAIARDRAFFEVVQHVEPGAAIAARERSLKALAPILRRAQKAGVVRADLVIEDVPALCAVAARLPAWRLEQQPELWRRYLGVVLDGVRAEAAHPLGHPPPKRAR